MTTPGERLRKLREERGLSAAQLGTLVKRSESAVRNQENGTNGIPFSLARKYAAALRTTVAFLMEGVEGATPISAAELAVLPIRGRVQAGAWLQVDEFSQVEPKAYPSAKDPRFPHADQWLSEVVGDSVNALGINDGDLVHVVDIWSGGWRPTTGDIVEVERERFQGQEREVTIKQVEVTQAGTYMLWPRSTNPRWKDPIRLAPEGMNAEDIEIRIRGLVIAAIRRFP